jgi:hypothetical protein
MGKSRSRIVRRGQEAERAAGLAVGTTASLVVVAVPNMVVVVLSGGDDDSSAMVSDFRSFFAPANVNIQHRSSRTPTGVHDQARA